MTLSDLEWLWLGLGLGLGLGLAFGLGFGLGLGRVADCCIHTDGESDKMRISHVIETDQWRAAPLCILSCDRPLHNALWTKMPVSE